MKKSFQDMAHRADEAHRSLVETIANLGAINTNEAERVAAFYIKNKLVKRNLAMSRYDVKHGAYYDRRAILRAVELSK